MILLFSGLALILASGVAAWRFERHPTAADRCFKWGVVGGCVLALVPAFSLFVGASAGPVGAEAWQSAPFGLDLLSAWFLVLVLGVGAAIAAYGVPYLARERSHRRVGRAHVILSVLLVALSGVVTARTILAFMVCWEVMALAAYFLVVFEHDRPEVMQAGMVYLVLTHVCTLALIGMFAAWAGGHVEWRFEDLANAAASRRVPLDLVLGLGLIGFGIKAGAFPFHFWLPGAHAAAPSHVSALLSGIMLKVGIYGLLRMLSLVGTPPAWWGWTLFVMGLASAVLGVLWALAQHDLKRLLAYHSIENIGIILLGLGLGALGSTYHQPAIALLGLAGAVLHSLNHALFKSSLFLGAGSVARSTGTRDIDRLGGLARRMPLTASAFLVGSAAIVGLPPLNGFVSEWVVFRGLLGTGAASGPFRLASVAAVGLALTGALALACFGKLYAAVFLGTPRDTRAPSHSADPLGLAVPQWVLAACCVAIGLLPTWALGAAIRAAARVAPGLIGDMDVSRANGASLALSAVSLAVLGLSALLWGLRRITSAGRPRVTYPTWACAYSSVSARMQYTASSFASSLLAPFGFLSGLREERSSGAFRTHASELILDGLARPLWNQLVTAATRLRPLQSGAIRWYLLYAILCLLGLLLYLRFLAAS